MRKRFKIGVVEADTRQDLGLGAVNHLGLGLYDRELEKNIGKLLTYKHPKTEYQRGEFLIVGIQKAWGYNEEGKYVPGIPSYRIVPKDQPEDFGHPINVSEAKLLN